MNCPACKQPMYVGLGTQPPVCDNRTCVRYAPSLSERQAGIKFPRPPLPRDAAKEVDVPATVADAYSVEVRGSTWYVSTRERCEEHRRELARTGTPIGDIAIVPVFLPRCAVEVRGTVWATGTRARCEAHRRELADNGVPIGDIAIVPVTTEIANTVAAACAARVRVPPVHLVSPHHWDNADALGLRWRSLQIKFCTDPPKVSPLLRWNLHQIHRLLDLDPT